MCGSDSNTSATNQTISGSCRTRDDRVRQSGDGEDRDYRSGRRFGCVRIRVPKTYPAYFGAYERFDEIKTYVNQFDNFFLVGRNGMHKYNNQDHSMLTAMTAVDNIIEGRVDKSNIWALNTEMEYHESKGEK